MAAILFAIDDTAKDSSTLVDLGMASKIGMDRRFSI
jgi:hypothetical protein